jgi:hypothetical protein
VAPDPSTPASRHCSQPAVRQVGAGQARAAQVRGDQPAAVQRGAFQVGPPERALQDQDALQAHPRQVLPCQVRPGQHPIPDLPWIFSAAVMRRLSRMSSRSTAWLSGSRRGYRFVSGRPRRNPRRRGWPRADRPFQRGVAQRALEQVQAAQVRFQEGGLQEAAAPGRGVAQVARFKARPAEIGRGPGPPPPDRRP